MGPSERMSRPGGAPQGARNLSSETRRHPSGYRRSAFILLAGPPRVPPNPVQRLAPTPPGFRELGASSWRASPGVRRPALGVMLGDRRAMARPAKLEVQFGPV